MVICNLLDITTFFTSIKQVMNVGNLVEKKVAPAQDIAVLLGNAAVKVMKVMVVTMHVTNAIVTIAVQIKAFIFLQQQHWKH